MAVYAAAAGLVLLAGGFALGVYVAGGRRAGSEHTTPASADRVLEGQQTVPRGANSTPSNDDAR